MPEVLLTLLTLEQYAKSFLVPQKKREAARDLLNDVQSALRAYCILQDLDPEDVKNANLTIRQNDGEEPSVECEWRRRDN